MATRRDRTETISSDAVEAPDLEAAAADAPRHGFFVRLYTGTGAFEVMGKRKLWYAISGLIVAIALGAILLRGFTFGIDFEGGTKVSLPARRRDRPPANRSSRSSPRRSAERPSRWSSSAPVPSRPSRSARRR